MTAHAKPALTETHETLSPPPDDAQERNRTQKDDAIAEQSDDDSPRYPTRKGSVPVSER